MKIKALSALSFQGFHIFEVLHIFAQLTSTLIVDGLKNCVPRVEIIRPQPTFYETLQLPSNFLSSIKSDLKILSEA